MIVECPECKVKYNLPDDKVKEGVKLKCSKCGHIFPYKPDKPDEPVDDKLELDEIDDTAIPEEESVSSGLTVQSDKKYRVNIEEAEEVKKDKKINKKKVFIIVFLTVVLILIGIAGYLFYPQIKSWIFPTSGKVESKLNKKQLEEKVKNIALENVKQYFVKNEKIGELFVIEGEAVNNFNQTKELIKIRATISDDKGNIIEKKEFLAGNSASLFQLQMMSKDELEGVLNSKIGILTNNTFVKPGGRVPFMVVFYNPPENVQEFGLEVIDVKNPPKKK
ncbi:MJ0042 family finger-like domain-containing protein [Desulfonauticus submarinus]|uniref:MJ0042 family finger-like domain-containing protein n=1 Tax=Desulfonauticus submarinus TaxID=206665 RepID=A0A1H0CH30_9BACT|nr:DUF3426 domain-containing protein [Desulfonauticus submarinus]SDN57175.1 MJ0042 family finger-like domain-containing protein [Desulfonauticus submarinus]